MAEKGFKNVVQLCMGSMIWAQFLPYWSKTDHACDSAGAGMDTVLAVFTSIAFWLCLWPTFHLLLNTFIFGQAPSWLMGEGKKLRTGKVIRESWGENYRTAKDNDLYEHDPKFWQRPTEVWEYFVTDLGNGSIAMGFWYYMETMVWKIGLLLKLTVGWWDKHLLGNMEVAQRAAQFDIDEFDDDSKHQAIMEAVGESHSLLWQFVPCMVIIAKMGEAMNTSLIFVAKEQVSTVGQLRVGVRARIRGRAKARGRVRVRGRSGLARARAAPTTRPSSEPPP